MVVKLRNIANMTSKKTKTSTDAPNAGKTRRYMQIEFSLFTNGNMQQPNFDELQVCQQAYSLP